MLEFLRNLVYEQYFLTIPEPTASFAHKTLIITGANSGLGKEAARYVSKLGCSRLILAVRNVNAGDEARKDILSSTSAPESSIAVWEVDLGSFESVRSFARRAIRELDRLDVLICNAGVNTLKYRESEGYESMLTTNVLSTYLMATLLLPLLERTANQGPSSQDPDPRPPHLCIVSSDTHLMAKFPERNEPSDKLLAAVTANCKNSGSRLREQYATSKLFDLLLVRDVVYRQRSSGPSTGTNAVSHPEEKCPVIINAPNPGLCRSKLTREMPGIARIMYFILRARPTKVGASALVNAASAGWETNGQLLSSNRVHHGSALSWNPAVAENLWSAVNTCLKDLER
jgi:NAD(P)-dependent dehydrogenase (short-subunit alcohol dehydrogenase family)